MNALQGGLTLGSPAPVGTAIMMGGSGLARNNYITMRISPGLRAVCSGNAGCCAVD